MLFERRVPDKSSAAACAAHISRLPHDIETSSDLLSISLPPGHHPIPSILTDSRSADNHCSLRCIYDTGIDTAPNASLCRLWAGLPSMPQLLAMQKCDRKKSGSSEIDGGCSSWCSKHGVGRCYRPWTPFSNELSIFVHLGFPTFFQFLLCCHLPLRFPDFQLYSFSGS
jgi:hypothetical protein